MSENLSERLIELEIRYAEQEKTIEDLSGEIAEQWKLISGMSKKLNALTNRFLELEEQTAPEVAVTKPPHW
ncbi:SlyX family protein [Pseudochrobactrum sp. MP213Fo]|uniref:SlyX family protein n=1 Tax=Pseudochrobactrum sp. MP213Fo TaxID=3022250 RepID=UPI003B9F0E50